MKTTGSVLSIFIFLLIISCGGKKNPSGKTDGKDSTTQKNDQQVNNPSVKIYQGKNMDKSKYPDDLYVVMPEEVRSSGYLTGKNEDYRDDFMIDHDPFTWWTPNPNRNGQGAWIELDFGKEVRIEGFEVWGGSHNPEYPKFGNIYKLNNRVRKGTCEFSDGSSIQFELTDVDNWQVVRFDSAITTKTIRLKITEVYKGEKWDDLCIAEFLALTPDEDEAYYGDEVAKPVIYLYPENKMDINVQLASTMNGTLDVTYPLYGKDGWNVSADPDGKLTDLSTGKKYQYLFWEGSSMKQWQFPDGFVVKGSESAAFLEEKLSHMGLLPNEYNDFIVYWLPLMMKNEYNLVRFANAEYNRDFPLIVDPAPQSMLRVFMIFKPLDTPIEIPEQHLEPFIRNGFTLVEWGGSAVQEDKDAL